MKYTFRIEAEIETDTGEVRNIRKDLEALSSEVGTLTKEVLPLIHRVFPPGIIVMCEVRGEVTSEHPSR